MKKIHLWHRSTEPALDFGGYVKPAVLHIGSLNQAYLPHTNGIYQPMSVALRNRGQNK